MMSLVLAAMLLAVGAGAAIMIVDGFIGIGVGWRLGRDRPAPDRFW